MGMVPCVFGLGLCEGTHTHTEGERKRGRERESLPAWNSNDEASGLLGLPVGGKVGRTAPR